MSKQKELEAYWEGQKDSALMSRPFDTKFPEAEFPLLWLLFSQTKRTKDDHSGFSITFFKDKDAFKVLLSDKVSGKLAFITIETLEDVFAYLDGVLADGSVDWRAITNGRG